MVPVHSENSILSEWARSQPHVARRDLSEQAEGPHARGANQATQSQEDQINVRHSSAIHPSRQGSCLPGYVPPRIR